MNTNKTRYRYLYWAGGLVMLMVGLFFTFQDYGRWYKAEWGKFGQGREDNRRPALVLNKLHENTWGGVRIRYPEEWKVEEARKINYPKDNFETYQVVEKEVLLSKWGEQMTLGIMKTKRTLPDIVVSRIAEIKKEGEMLRDTEGLRLETIDEGRILTWKSGETVHQEIITKRGDKVVLVGCKANTNDWSNWEKTWLAIFDTLVVY